MYVYEYTFRVERISEPFSLAWISTQPHVKCMYGGKGATPINQYDSVTTVETCGFDLLQFSSSTLFQQQQLTVLCFLSLRCLHAVDM